MAITFKHVSENDTVVNKQKNTEVKKENKPVEKKKVKKYFSLSDNKYQYLYWVFAKIIAIFSLVVGIFACGCSLVLYWFTNVTDEKIVNISRIIKVVLNYCGFVVAALLLAGSIVTALKRGLELRMHVFNWMLFLLAVGLSVLVVLTPIKTTATRNFQNNLTGMSFMSILFIMSFASMWTFSHGPEDVGYIDIAGLNPVAFLFIFLAVANLFEAVVAFRLSGSPTIQEGENAYFRLWSMAESIMIASGCIVFGLVFTMMEEGTDFVIKTVFAGIMVALSITACVFILICDQSDIYKKHILIGVFGILGSAGSIAMTPVMFKSMY